MLHGPRVRLFAGYGAGEVPGTEPTPVRLQSAHQAYGRPSIPAAAPPSPGMKARGLLHICSCTGALQSHPMGCTQTTAMVGLGWLLAKLDYRFYSGITHRYYTGAFSGITHRYYQVLHRRCRLDHGNPPAQQASSKPCVYHAVHTQKGRAPWYALGGAARQRDHSNTLSKGERHTQGRIPWAHRLRCQITAS